jgi:hypothetical protein
MSAATPHRGKFARSLCWSPAGHGTARPQAQTTKPKLQKIGPPNRTGLALTTLRVAKRSLQPPRPHPTAAPPAPKSP